jgi:hypothetical protein
MSRAEDAVQRIYESADVRDELTDDEAEPLLKWAEAELTRLDASGADDATFDAKVVTLMDLLKQMNRYAGKQGQLSAEADDQTPGAIASLAGSLGHSADTKQIAAAGTGDPTSTINRLTELMGGAAVPAESFTAESAPEPPPIIHPTVTPQPPNAIKPHLPHPPSISADPDPAGDKS